MAPSTKRILRTNEDDVSFRLNEHFGATRDELVHIVQMAVGARRNSTVDDPATAPGMLSYIYGTRGLRNIFRPKEWMSLREKGIESVFSEKRNIRLVFQNVDLAADPCYVPQAISKKNTASKELINAAQGDLFTLPSAKPSPLETEPSEVWYLCVSCDDVAGIRAELSRPVPIQNEQFVDFHERIFIVQKGDLEDIRVDKDLDMPEQNYDIQISRK